MKRRSSKSSTVPSCAARWWLDGVVAGAAVVLALPMSTWACDLCALSNGGLLRPHRSGFAVAANQQYTSFNTLKGPGKGDVAIDEWMQSSITTLSAGYGFSMPVRVELALPVINREFRRAGHDGDVERGDETGIGDITVFGRWMPVERFLTDGSVVRVELFGGLELPTGDTDQLGEKDDGDEHADASLVARDGAEGEAPSGIHGHDIALGSGSVDAILGLGAFAARRRLFANGGFQYGVRSRGDHDYRYANDFLFHLAAGYLAVLRDEVSAGVALRLNGEIKGKDDQDGETVGDSAITALYLGPHAHFTGEGRGGVEIGAEFPVLQDNTGLQIVADYRIVARVAWAF